MGVQSLLGAIATPLLVGTGLMNLNDRVNEDRAEGRQRRADQQAQRAATADVEPVIKEASDGMGPSAVMVGKQAYGNEADADSAANAYNAPDAKIARLKGVFLNQANPSAAMDLEKSSIDMAAYRRRAADVIESEGINHFVDANLGAAPSVNDIESGKASTFDLSGVDDFNKQGGKLTIPEGSKGQWKVLTFDNGRKVADFQVIGPDGQPLSPISARTLQSIHAQSLSEREKQADSQFKEGADIKLKRDELDARNRYWEGMVAAATTRADKTGAGRTLEEKLPPGVRAEVAGIDEEIKSLATSVYNGMSSGNLDASRTSIDNPDGTKTPTNYGVMQSRLAALKMRRSALIQPYLGESNATPDPLGLRNDAAFSGQPSFEVTGDPAAFRKKLAAGGADAETLRQFDAKYPAKTDQKPVASQGVMPDSGAAASQPTAVSRVMSRLGALFAPNWDAQAQQALLTQDKNLIQTLLKPGSDSEKGMSAPMKQKLANALQGK